MPAYLEIRKRQIENNEVLKESNRSSHNSMTARIRYDNGALNANNDNNAIYENDDDDGLNENDDDDGLNENVDAIDIDREGDQEFDQQDVAQYGMEVGPTKEIIQEFKFFLGTVARDSELAPLNYFNFPSLPTLDKIWNYVQAKMDAVESSQDEDDLKKKANKPDFIFPKEFISSVTTAVLAQIREANPGINIVIPDVLLQSTPDNSSSAPIQIESVTIVANLPNQ
uniref:Uncharacterized protein n=1 Tax=Chenopodium quinoa TaxID=63459 RepID=A0A803LYX3_CHEQI